MWLLMRREVANNSYCLQVVCLCLCYFLGLSLKLCLSPCLAFSASAFEHLCVFVTLFLRPAPLAGFNYLPGISEGIPSAL